MEGNHVDSNMSLLLSSSSESQKKLKNSSPARHFQTTTRKTTPSRDGGHVGVSILIPALEGRLEKEEVRGRVPLDTIRHGCGW